MEAFLKVVELVVMIEATAIAVAFAVGMIVAPAVVLVQRACWWKKRVKWAAVCALTSWMGLWFFLRDQRGSRSRLRRATSIRSS